MSALWGNIKLKIFNYFQEFLTTLKSIDKSLKEIAKCVVKNNRNYGENYYLSTGSWNDKSSNY